MASPLLNEDAYRQQSQESGHPWALATKDKGTMTVAGTATATGVLLVLLCVAAAFGWGQVTPFQPIYSQFNPNEVIGYSGGSIPAWIWIAGIIGFIAAIAGQFVPKLSPLLGPIYALSYGTVVGAISALYEQQFQGIVLQAVLATIAVFFVMFVLYATRIIKVTRKYVLIVMGAMIGLLLMYLVAFVASLFGADLYFWNHPTPLGIAISIGIVILAAATLAIDFAFIEQVSHSSAPRYMEWYGALGLTIGLVWLYLSILRVLALLRQ